MDTNPTDGDEIYKEYDELGRNTSTQLDTGDWTYKIYYGTTQDIYQEHFFESAWNWKGYIEYWEAYPGVKKSEGWVDTNPTDGDEIYKEYDELERQIKTQLDTGDWITTSYYGTTSNKYQESFFDSTWDWQKTIEYWEAYPNVKHYEWLVDPDGIPDGDDVVYKEYDTTGTCIGGSYDDGSPWTPPSGGSLMNGSNESFAELLARKEIESQNDDLKKALQTLGINLSGSLSDTDEQETVIPQ